MQIATNIVSTYSLNRSLPLDALVSKSGRYSFFPISLSLSLSLSHTHTPRDYEKPSTYSSRKDK
jgi:hypothetical protein